MLKMSAEVRSQGQCGGNTQAGGIGLTGWRDWVGRVEVVPGGCVWGVGEYPILKAH